MENSEIIQRPKTESGYSEKKQAQQIEGSGMDVKMPGTSSVPQQTRKRLKIKSRRDLTENSTRRDI